jgi:hypothetical protein
LLSTALARATSGTRPYIRVKGTIEVANGDINNKALTFLGQANAVLRGSQLGGGGGGDNPILDVRGGAVVSIFDLSLRDGRREGILVDGAGTELQLVRSKVVNVGNDGVLVSNGGKESIVQSEISDCDGVSRYGVNVTAGQVEISRSKIFENSGGVFVADNQPFQITNSFIVENKTHGGLRILKPTATSKLEFNTIADNRHGSTGILDAAGVLCDDAAYTFGNNIIFRNIGGSTGYLQTMGVCRYGNSLLSPNEVAEVRELQLLKETAPRDHHLTANSPSIAKDVSGVTCTGLIDFDGDSRPQGGVCDLGADEVK